MKFSKIYTNRDDIFRPIVFNSGLNVIMGQVLARDDDKKDAHNLGKSLLIDVLDFCLLIEVKKDFFLKKHYERFRNIVFFLEIELASSFITIRRSVDEMTRISFKKHPERGADFRVTPEEQWDHWRVTFQNSVELLDSYLKLTAVGDHKYRKGHTYFLRRQQDFTDVFVLSKFSKNKDKDWKPFVAHLLGFDQTVISDKYSLDESIGELEQDLERQRKEGGVTEEDYDRLKGQIEFKEDQISGKARELDNFDLHSAEIESTRVAAEDIDTQISELNEQIYNLRVDLEQAKRSLTIDITFDIKGIKQVFDEAKIAFPEQLKQDYEGLLEFNKKIHAERHSNLRERIATLDIELAAKIVLHKFLNEKRTSLLSALRGGNSFEKFKKLQKTLDQERAELEALREKIAKADMLFEKAKTVTDKKADLVAAGEKISAMVRGESPIYSQIRLEFARIVKEVLDRSADIWISQNGQGNIEFHAEYSQSDGIEHTSEGNGFTYKKFLCMVFDLALLSVYHDKPFYHFVYHDGALETLDPRRKIRWLEVVKRICDEKGIQYILSLIEGDLPRDVDDNPVEFESGAIVLRLNDKDDSGRLFKMPCF
jgi:uncharacterized protein YydD (DUF2326 family)